MITIVTGTPGSGKTLYTVSKLMRALLAQYIDAKGEDGEVVKKQRRVFSNIKGLMLDHELIGPGGTWKQDKGGEWQFDGPGQGLRDWHTWAKPGDVIVYDEVQEVWKPRANGAAVPPDIGALETHRHMGVDFVLITQGISLTERNLSMLCGRHLHVRRVANMPFAVVYEWDGASRSLLFSQSLAREKWWYDRSAYKLYKSAEVHTKSPRRLPAVLMLVLFGIVATGVLGPTIYSRYGERFGWTKPLTLPGQPKAPTGPSGPLPAPVGPAPASSVATGPAEKAVPEFTGCAAMGKRCTCFDAKNQPFDKGPGFCQAFTEGAGGKPLDLVKLRIPDQELHQRELDAIGRDDTLAWMRERAERSSTQPRTVAKAARGS